MTQSSDNRTVARVRPSAGWGVGTGLVTAVVALGTGQLVAGFTGAAGAPVAAVGAAAIDLTPPPVKDFAISAFGSHDKTVLIIGILVLLAVFAALIGVAALRRLEYGLAGLGAFTLIGLAAALTRPGAVPTGALPVLAGAAAGGLVMARLVRLAGARGAVAHSAPPVAGPHSPPHATGPHSPPPAAGPSSPPPTAREEGTAAPPSGPGRRRFLVTSSAAVVAAGVGTFAGRSLTERAGISRARAGLRLPAPTRPGPSLPPGTDFHIPGLTRFVTPNSTFYRVDTALILPQVPPGTWRLRIHGMVGREMTVTYDDLLRMPLAENYVTLTCVSNPVGGPYISNARWLGASLAGLLRAARIRSTAQQLICTSVDGFTSGTPVQAVMDGHGDALLAVAMNGAPLPVAHGFPVRMVIPGLYGYVSATKWLTDIYVTTWAERAYWVQRGWSQRAPVKTEARIDVPGAGAAVRGGRAAVAGVAWAQHRGVDAVQVRVDHGPWHQARLAAVPGADTWRQWVWYWDATPGHHVIEARATDATGHTQTAAVSAPEPNGATGYPSVTVNVA